MTLKNNDQKAAQLDDNQKMALLLDDNLMTTTRVQKQLERAGYAVRALGVLPASSEMTPDLVLINLGSRSLDSVDLIPGIKTQFPDTAVMGFCGHTEVAIRKAAKAAGMKRIFTNEEAMMELADLLSAAAR